jgi:hypothetical protein
MFVTSLNHIKEIDKKYKTKLLRRDGLTDKH